MTDLGDFFPSEQRPDQPAYWWRKVCWATDRLAVSGDLPSDRSAAREHLRYWESEGVTDVIDVRVECNDTEFIELHSDITCYWFGVDDNGDTRDPAWFTQVADCATMILGDPSRRLLVHCHVGVNRGPSAAYAIMLDQGWHHVRALEAIRDSRPIAVIRYADDAVRWHAARSGPDRDAASQMIGQVDDWQFLNALDELYVHGEIGRVRESTWPYGSTS